MANITDPRAFAEEQERRAANLWKDSDADADEDRRDDAIQDVSEDSYSGPPAPRLADFLSPREYARAFELHAQGLWRTDARERPAPAPAIEREDETRRHDAVSPAPEGWTVEGWNDPDMRASRERFLRRLA